MSKLSTRLRRLINVGTTPRTEGEPVPFHLSHAVVAVVVIVLGVSLRRVPRGRISQSITWITSTWTTQTYSSTDDG